MCVRLTWNWKGFIVETAFFLHKLLVVLLKQKRNAKVKKTLDNWAAWRGAAAQIDNVQKSQVDLINVTAVETRSCSGNCRILLTTLKLLRRLWNFTATQTHIQYVFLVNLFCQSFLLFYRFQILIKFSIYYSIIVQRKYIYLDWLVNVVVIWIRCCCFTHNVKSQDKICVILAFVLKT